MQQKMKQGDETVILIHQALKQGDETGLRCNRDY